MIKVLILNANLNYSKLISYSSIIYIGIRKCVYWILFLFFFFEWTYLQYIVALLLRDIVKNGTQIYDYLSVYFSIKNLSL